MTSQNYAKEINKVFIHEIIDESKSLKFTVNFHQQNMEFYLSESRGQMYIIMIWIHSDD